MFWSFQPYFRQTIIFEPKIKRPGSGAIKHLVQVQAQVHVIVLENMVQNRVQIKIWVRNVYSGLDLIWVLVRQDFKASGPQLYITSYTRIIHNNSNTFRLLFLSHYGNYAKFKIPITYIRIMISIATIYTIFSRRCRIRHYNDIVM